MSTETMPVEQNEVQQPAEAAVSGQVYRPNVDILEGPQELLVHADMPGLSGENIDIHFEDGTLTVHGRIKSRQPQDTKYLVREYGVGDYHRTFRISDEIDPSRITAECHDGVLTLHLPKSEAAKPRKIQVQVGNG